MYMYNSIQNDKTINNDLQQITQKGLKSLLWKLYGRHHDFVDRYEISVSQMTTDMFPLT
jgi:hypothetical protein